MIMINNPVVYISTATVAPIPMLHQAVVVPVVTLACEFSGAAVPPVDALEDEPPPVPPFAPPVPAGVLETEGAGASGMEGRGASAPSPFPFPTSMAKRIPARQ